jgi:hypothetical protein
MMSWVLTITLWYGNVHTVVIPIATKRLCAEAQVKYVELYKKTPHKIECTQVAP